MAARHDIQRGCEQVNRIENRVQHAQMAPTKAREYRIMSLLR